MERARLALLVWVLGGWTVGMARADVPDQRGTPTRVGRFEMMPIPRWLFPPPTNDNCANATPISGEGIFAFDNRGATTDGPPHESCRVFSQAQIANDLWYCWTAPCDGGVRFETCGLTHIDTKIAVYRGCTCPVGDAELIDCNEDDCGLQSGILFEALAGQQYLLRVGNFAGPSGFAGAGAFSIRCVPIPANDACADAIGPLAIPSVTAGSTEFAGPDAAPACTAPLTSPNVWYTVVGTGTTITASLCNAATTYDSRIAVYCGPCGDLTCVGGNDQFCGDQSQISWCSAAGVTYSILVHGFNAAAGPFELELSADGQTCQPTIVCAEPATGACCLCDSITCAVLTEAECMAAGGTYQGDDTTCDSPSLARFRLHNHPDGDSAPPLYGLRLDGLLTGDEEDVFVFDFDHAQSAMFMEVDGSSIRLHGQAYGGLVVGNAFVDAVVWDVDFTYAAGVGAVPGDDDLWVTDCGHVNVGTIQAHSGPHTSPIALVDECGTNPFSFRFGNEDDDAGHRGFAGQSGWGWLNHGDGPHLYYSDWLFTAESITECTPACD